MRSLAETHDLVYETPPRIWEDGFPIGNGHFGSMVWQPEGPDRVVLGITKLDVWDRRYREDALVPFDRYRRLLATDPRRATAEVLAEPDYDVSYPSPKLCGMLSLGINEDLASLPLVASLARQGQRLRLAEATVECDYELSTNATRITAFVAPALNVLAIQVENTWVHGELKLPFRQRIILGREIDEELGLPTARVDGNVLMITYLFPDGFTYVMAASIDGAEVTRAVALPDQARAIAVVPRMERGPVYAVYLTVATSVESPNPEKAALGNLSRAESTGWEGLHQEQRRFWAAFWDASGVELSDRFLEGLWYFSLYQLASTCRGPVAPGLFGLWNMTASPAWHGDYHGDYNLSMAHWFLFSANHLELGEPYFRTLSEILPIAKRQTMDLYQVDGVKFPIATAPWTGVEMTRGIYRMMQISSAYNAIPYLWRWRYSRDREFLRDSAFPFLEEASKFYLAITEETRQGLVIGPTWAPEQGPLPAYNANNDLGLIRVVWEGYVEACDVLDRRTPWLAKVKDCLSRYPDFPQSNGRFLDSATAPEDLMMAHTGLFSMVYPGGEIDADHPLAAVAARTIDTQYERTQRRSFADRTTISDVLAWTTQALGSARLRRSHMVDHYLVDVGLSEYLKPNGMLSILSNGLFRTIEEKRAAYKMGARDQAPHVLYPCASTRHGRDRQFQFLEGVSSLVCIVNEMLLQSHKGMLRIFPSVPDRIPDCAFKDLRAEGAFLVSARCIGGRSARVEIQSLAGSDCAVRLFRFTPGTAVEFRGPGGVFEPERSGDDTWRFPTRQGEAYSIDVGGTREPVRLVPPADPPGVKSFIDCHGDAVFYGKAAP